LQKGDWAIWRSFAHCKRAIEQFVAHLLIAKEQLSNLSLIRSLQKSDWTICRSFAHCKRAIERFVAHPHIAKERLLAQLLFRSFKKSERAKMSEKWAISQIAHFLLKKRAIAHFQNERLPNPEERPWKINFFVLKVIEKSEKIVYVFCLWCKTKNIFRNYHLGVTNLFVSSVAFRRVYSIVGLQKLCFEKGLWNSSSESCTEPGPRLSIWLRAPRGS